MEQLEQVGADAAKLAAAPLWSLGDDELIDMLRAAHRHEQTFLVLQARLVAQARSRGIPAVHGYRSAARWLQSLLLLDPRPAREVVEAATASARPVLEQAMLQGQVDPRQAAVIAASVGAIPADLHATEVTGDQQPETGTDELATGDVRRIVDDAERTMVEMAGRLPAYQLRRVGERILAYVAPQVAERAEEAALARQERRAQRRRGLTLSLPVDGLVRLSGALGVEDAATVTAALHPLCQPLPEDQRTPEQRRADAMVEVCRLALRTKELPEDGGEPTQVSVTVEYQPLTHALGSAVTDTGQRMSAATARRMACDAKILPVVLGGAGQILDVGRARRLATGTLRRALHIRDRGCAFPDCDRPPRWTDAHHITPWTAGGATALDNLVLLCRHHHRLIHHPNTGWLIRRGADGLPDFVPPPHLDRDQRPRRNLYHPKRRQDRDPPGNA